MASGRHSGEGEPKAQALEGDRWLDTVLVVKEAGQPAYIVREAAGRSATSVTPLVEAQKRGLILGRIVAAQEGPEERLVSEWEVLARPTEDPTPDSTRAREEASSTTRESGSPVEAGAPTPPTRVQVEAARLRLITDTKQGKTSPDWVRELAAKGA